MKKIILLITLTIFSSSLFASPYFSRKPYQVARSKHSNNSSYSSSYSSNSYFLSLGVIENSSEENKILGVQPLSEIVGEGGTEFDLKFGIVTEDKAIKVYLFGWSNSDKNNELGLGFGGEWGGHIISSVPKLKLYLGAEMGFGYQPVSGDSKTISTSVNKLTFVTDEAVLTPTKMTYTEDTTLLNINLILGANYPVTNNVDIDIFYRYSRSQYQFSYRTEEDSSIENSLTEQQDNHGIGINLNYRF